MRGYTAYIEVEGRPVESKPFLLKDSAMRHMDWLRYVFTAFGLRTRGARLEKVRLPNPCCKPLRHGEMEYLENMGLIRQYF